MNSGEPLWASVKDNTVEKIMKQLLTYFGLAYLISWTVWLPLYGHSFGLTNLPTLPYHHGLGGLGPLIASFLTTWIFQRKEGINLLQKTKDKRQK